MGLFRVEAPHFVAGFVTESDRVVLAAPILRWAVGKELDDCRAYFENKGWRLQRVRDMKPESKRGA